VSLGMTDNSPIGESFVVFFVLFGTLPIFCCIILVVLSGCRTFCIVEYYIIKNINSTDNFQILLYISQPDHPIPLIPTNNKPSRLKNHGYYGNRKGKNQFSFNE
jgi:hypothetical protein